MRKWEKGVIYINTNYTNLTTEQIEQALGLTHKDIEKIFSEEFNNTKGIPTHKSTKNLVKSITKAIINGQIKSAVISYNPNDKIVLKASREPNRVNIQREVKQLIKGKHEIASDDSIKKYCEENKINEVLPFEWYKINTIEH